ncbi:MAG: RNA polymerase factor sigma-32 [Deltaproteobacteria bacterium]|nr:RNA polymerase factor sigma-32 [Deltaproteobacteria bacterium]
MRKRTRQATPEPELRTTAPIVELRDPDETSRALVPLDPLARYLGEVRRYPYLTEAEERALAIRVREHGDVDAARQLVQSHLRLVVKIAMEYRSAYYNLVDLIQEGSVGLLVAVRKYDIEKGSRLSYYASLWIRSYILKYILDNFRLMKIGTTKEQRKLFFNLVQEKQRMEALGFKPDARLLAGRLGVTIKAIEEMGRRLEQPELALDAPVGHESKSATFGDFVADNDVPIDEKLAQQEFKDALAEQLQSFVHQLKPRDAQIFQERLLAEVPRTLQEIADEYGITKERIRQLEARLVVKLREHLMKAGIQGTGG